MGKDKYIEPEIDIIEFDTNDIIVTSSNNNNNELPVQPGD